MKQGEIWNVFFDPVKGREQAGNRPAIIISGNTMNENSNLLIVCPLTSSLHYYKGHPIIEPSLENGLKCTSEVLVFQIRSLSKDRFKKKLGTVPNITISSIHEVLNKILKY